MIDKLPMEVGLEEVIIGLRQSGGKGRSGSLLVDLLLPPRQPPSPAGWSSGSRTRAAGPEQSAWFQGAAEVCFPVSGTGPALVSSLRARRWCTGAACSTGPLPLITGTISTGLFPDAPALAPVLARLFLPSIPSYYAPNHTFCPVQAPMALRPADQIRCSQHAPCQKQCSFFFCAARPA